MSWSSTRSSARIRPRLTRPRANCSRSGRRRRRWMLSPPRGHPANVESDRSGAAAEGGRRRQPGAVDPPLRPSRRAARSARLPPARRSVAAAGDARRHRRGSARAAGDADSLAAGRRRGARWHEVDRGVAPRLLLDAPATTTRTSSCPRSATGCARPSRPAGSARRPIRSIRSRCSSG